MSKAVTLSSSNPCDWVFFDIDGTLHREDAFLLFCVHCLRVRAFNALLLLPFLILSALIYLVMPKAKLGIALFFWLLWLGASTDAFHHAMMTFAKKFLKQHTPHPDVQKQLQMHLAKGAQIVLITGSPSVLMAHLYPKLSSNSQVTLLGSEFNTKFASLWLAKRAFASEKCTLVDRHFRRQMTFTHGYSDSRHDLPIMQRCQYQHWIDKSGRIQSSAQKSSAQTP